MLVGLDVVVDVDAGLAPGRELVPARGQGPQLRAFQRLEQALPAAVDLLERPGVDLRDAVPDRRVGLGEREEPAVAQPGEDPPLGDQDTVLGLGLVAGLVRPCRDHRDSVVGGHLGVGGVHVRLVPVRAGHPRAQVVADHDRRAAAHGLERVHVPGHPVQQLLRGERLGEQVAGRAGDGDEQLGPQGNLPGPPVPDRDRVAGEIDEQLLPGPGD